MVSESKSGDDDTDTDVEEDPIVDQGTRTGCRNTCGNWARSSKSSLLRVVLYLITKVKKKLCLLKYIFVNGWRLFSYSATLNDII